MQILILIPAMIIFLYCLYKLTRDDYVLIRRNISLEQVFDIAFIVFLVSLLIARASALLFHPVATKNIFSTFFSIQNGGFSLTGALLGALGILFAIGKIKKIPLGRFFDFFTFAFLVALPVGYLCYSLILRTSAMYLHLMTAMLYLALTIFFMKFLYPRLMNRSLKEGNVTILFFVFFSLVSLLNILLTAIKSKVVFLQPENVILVTLLVFSLLILTKQERSRFRSRRKTF